MRTWLEFLGLAFLYISGCLFFFTLAWLLYKFAMYKQKEALKRQEPIDNMTFYDRHGEKISLDERIKANAAEIRKVTERRG